MYIVNITNDGVVTTINGEKRKLHSGSVVQGINTIDSFTFSVLPDNIGFNLIKPRKTLVSVYNTLRDRYEFRGRVLLPTSDMSENGLLTREAVCESVLGFFCDSQQPYVEERNWTYLGLWEHIIARHNEQLEDYKHFAVGNVSVLDATANVYVGIQRENTWKTIEEKIIGKLGGEIRYRVSGGVTYIDHLPEIGEASKTRIALSRNMKTIRQEIDPAECITRLIPLGCKLKKEETTTDADGNTTTQTVETEERLDISAVNNGKNYLDDEAAKAEYGIVVGRVEFDDVTNNLNLLRKGKEYLAEHSRVKVKYTATALDLSLLGLDIDDYQVGNRHPLDNPLLSIADNVRIIKKNIDIFNDTTSSIDFGDQFKTAAQLAQSDKNSTAQKIESIKSEVNNKISGTIIRSMGTEYYLSESESALVGGEWVATPPEYTASKYLWIRSKIAYDNPPKIIYTAATYDATWKSIRASVDALTGNIYYPGTTMIDGGKIYTESVTADKINVKDLFAQNIFMTGKFTTTAEVFFEPGFDELIKAEKFMLGEEIPTEEDLTLYDLYEDGGVGMEDYAAYKAAVYGEMSLFDAWVREDYPMKKSIATVTIDISNPQKAFRIQGVNMWGREVDEYWGANSLFSGDDAYANFDKMLRRSDPIRNFDSLSNTIMLGKHCICWGQLVVKYAATTAASGSSYYGDSTSIEGGRFYAFTEPPTVMLTVRQGTTSMLEVEVTDVDANGINQVRIHRANAYTDNTGILVDYIAIGVNAWATDY